MASTTGYSQTTTGVYVADSGLPTAGAAAFSSIWAYGHYDFAVKGGAVGSISLLGTARIPAKSMLIGGFVRVTTPLTSGGAATAAIGVMGAGDTVAAAAVSGAPWSSTGTKAVIPVYTAASSIVVTTAADITLTVATANLTAGVFDVYLLYIPILA